VELSSSSPLGIVAKQVPYHSIFQARQQLSQFAPRPSQPLIVLQHLVGPNKAYSLYNKEALRLHLTDQTLHFARLEQNPLCSYGR
jgi:hypothetical protein